MAEVQISLGEAQAGELVLWKHTGPFGETIAQVLETTDQDGHVIVKADNGITYTWAAEMVVTVDR